MLFDESTPIDSDSDECLLSTNCSNCVMSLSEFYIFSIAPQKEGIKK